jgi:hypothetical protein
MRTGGAARVQVNARQWTVLDVRPKRKNKP